MARSVIRLEGTELNFFHKNYNYMWKKLNTAPYYVSGFGETPSWIRNADTLPSYVNLSKCMNPDYVPSINLVNKIVHFYNANIAPAIDTYAFLHEALENSDRVRTPLACACLEPYCGIYYGYYYSEAEDEQYIRGALIRIFDSDGELRVNLLYDLTTDEELQNPHLLKILQSDDISESFAAYKKGLPLSESLISLFTGSGRIAPGVISMQMKREDSDGIYMMLQLPSGTDSRGEYIGSLGMAFSSSSDRTFQLYRFGLERAGYKSLCPISLSDPKLKNLLSLIKGRNERVIMSPSDNKAWTNYMVLSNTRNN